MLILTRKAGEAVVIDGGLRITLLAMDGRTARLGIEAPSDVKILRAEIVDQVAEQTLRAPAKGREWIAIAPATKPR